jgi:AbrB family looped-hinge helix DNA binding protein
METAKIGRKGTVIIRAKLRKQLGLDEGDLMIAELINNGVLLRPAEVVAADEKAWAEDLIRRSNAAYARLRQDPLAWADEIGERRELEATLLDGLEDEPWEEPGPGPK